MSSPIVSRAESFLDELCYALFGGIMRRFVVLSVRSEEEVLRKTEMLRREGFQTSFDLMVEDIPENDTGRVLNFYRNLLGNMRGDNIGNIVVKPTALGLHASASAEVAQKNFRNRMEDLLLAMNAEGEHLDRKFLEIEVDAESLRTMDEAFRTASDLRRDFPLCRTKIRVAVPMHRKDLQEVIARFHLLDHPVRIVKGTGVYNEAPEALVGEKEVLLRYETHVLECLAKKKHPYIATMRDRNTLERLLNKAESLGYRKDEFTIQMLYGLFTGMGRDLLARGYRVSLYVPVTLPWCEHASDGYVKRRVSMMRKLIFHHATLGIFHR